MRRNIEVILMALVTCLSIGCEHQPIEPAFKPGGFFPHTAGSRWKYELSRNCDSPMQSEICTQTMWSAAGPEIFPDGVTLFPDSIYSPMISYTTMMQFVKVVGHEYFAVGYYMPEYKFLDDGLRVNTTWGSPFEWDDNYKIETRVTEVNVTKIVRGKTYPHVIVVTETNSYITQDPKYNVKTTVLHYYAYEVGEIYMKRTQETDGRVDISEYTLLEYYIAPLK